MNERDIAKKITQNLNYGTNNLDRSVLVRLQAARQQALAAHAKPQEVLGLAVSGHGQSHHHGLHFSARFWISLALLVLGMALAFNWQMGDNPMLDDDDAPILTGDLPVHAYLDSDLTQWLEDQSSRE